ncbi:MAG: Hsp70 family protein [Verrucomicrobia bacterium]|nr:Hsp70 family protein [Verrucomicrobiota bacterium]
MNRTTIDFGIDLGTTNSAIAILKGVSAEVVKNNSDSDITPSAVSLDRSGTVQVGHRARNKLIYSPEDAYSEFKRRMGTEHRYEFKSCGQVRTPEDLSSEVLKSLRGDVQQRLNEWIDAAVITVPAAFELHQCAATRRAAELAGFLESPLLQEPVAAALAYGFQAEEERSYWMVYDFGGGTFDAAVIKSDSGIIQVVNHGGDNHLGGADIDWAVVEELIVPQLLEQNLLDDFKRGNPKWRQVFAKLKRAAETAKIDLSRSERTLLETCRFEDDMGHTIEFEAELKREHVVRVAEPIIRRSVEICRRVLKEKELEPSDIDRVILVGGPTLAPYFREQLTHELGIPLDLTVDPLTAVAKGAAVFAGTQKRTLVRPAFNRTAQDFRLEISCPPMGIEDQPSVGARVSSEAVSDFTGFTVEIANHQTQWRSGRISLRPDGVFLVSVHAVRGQRNTFSIELLDPQGQRQPILPEEFHYTIGSVVEEQPLIHSLGLALADNRYDRFFPKGCGLPQRSTRTFKSLVALRKGQGGELLRIPLVEGENDLADRNRRVGELLIHASKLSRDLPSDSSIEVSLSIDANRLIRITAYSPLLDEQFDVSLDLSRHQVDPNLLANDFKIELDRFESLKSNQTARYPGLEGQVQERFEQSPLVPEVRQLLAAAPGDPDAATKCERRLLELKLLLDEIIGSLEWPALTAQARDTLRSTQAIAENRGSRQDQDAAQELSNEIDDAIRAHCPDRLRKLIESTGSLYFRVASSDPEFWVQLFNNLAAQKDSMTDVTQAERLVEHGQLAVAERRIESLKSIVQALFRLHRRPGGGLGQRGYQSGLI